MKWRTLIIVTSLLVLLGCAPHEVKPQLASEETRRLVEVGVILAPQQS